MNDDDLARAQMPALQAIVAGILRHMQQSDPKALEQILGYATQDAMKQAGDNQADRTAILAQMGSLLGTKE